MESGKVRDRSRSPRLSESEAREALEQLDRSGLTAIQWCREQGISPSRVFGWRSKLHSGKWVGVPTPSQARFLEVRVSPSEVNVAPGRGADWPLEMELPSHIRLRIGATVDASLLRLVLDVVSEVSRC